MKRALCFIATFSVLVSCASNAPDSITDRTLSFQETAAPYVKITVTPVQSTPGWHYGAGNRTFVSIDEIIVR